MKLTSTYSVKIGKPVGFKPTVSLYRDAVDYFIQLIITEWDTLAACQNSKQACNATEKLSIITKTNPNPKYDFSGQFYKFPSYLRRAAIACAYGLVSSYKTHLAKWYEEPKNTRGKMPTPPKAGFVCPALYKDGCFVKTGTYTARIKAWVRNTWDWVEVTLRKTDVDYILRHCGGMAQKSPTLRQRGKDWCIDFPFEKTTQLVNKPATQRRIVSVDLGLINACTCSVMDSDGTVVGRRFLSMPSEYDCLKHALGRIKRGQQSHARHMPRHWGRAKGIVKDISAKTAKFICDVAREYNADVIVMEALDLKGKKKGGAKQKLHHWRAQYVQQMVMHKAHLNSMRFSHVCARNTSRLAFDGSGYVFRGKKSEKTGGNYSLCEFSSGKVYNCDLNASYNIGARYFIREILGEMPERARSEYEAKVPFISVRSTCTLSCLLGLRAAMEGMCPPSAERRPSDMRRDSDPPKAEPSSACYAVDGCRMHPTLVG